MWRALAVAQAARRASLTHATTGHAAVTRIIAAWRPLDACGLCTNSGAGNDDSSENDDDDDDDEPIRSIFYHADGTVAFEVNPSTKFDETFDWAALELAAGITRGEDADDQSDIDRKLDELPDGVLDFEMVLDTHTGTLDMVYGETDNAYENDSEEDEFDSSRGSITASLAKRRSSCRHAGPQSLPRDVASPATTRSPWDAVPPALPKHKRNLQKPGMHRRVAMLEAEMERIVTELTCKTTEWVRSGNDVDGVGLSANMRDLTVFYSGNGNALNAVDDDSAAEKKRRDGALRQRVFEMEALVRRRIASDMDLKYAPRVHFQQASTTLSAGGSSELDALFEKISQERSNCTKTNGSEYSGGG
jgi:ribosome-binding factor A